MDADVLKKSGAHVIELFCLCALVWAVAPTRVSAETFSDRSHDWNPVIRYQDATEECVRTSKRFAENRARHNCRVSYKGDKGHCETAEARENVQHSYENRYTAECTVEVTITVPDFVRSVESADSVAAASTTPQMIKAYTDSELTTAIYPLSSRLQIPTCGQRDSEGRFAAPAIEFSDYAYLLNGLDKSQKTLAEIYLHPKPRKEQLSNRAQGASSKGLGDIQLERAITHIFDSTFEQNVLNCRNAGNDGQQASKEQILKLDETKKVGETLSGLLQSGALKCTGSITGTTSEQSGSLNVTPLPDSQVRLVLQDVLKRFETSIEGVRLIAFKSPYDLLFRIAEEPRGLYSYALLDLNSAGKVQKVQLRQKEMARDLVYSRLQISCSR